MGGKSCYFSREGNGEGKKAPHTVGCPSLWGRILTLRRNWKKAGRWDAAGGGRGVECRCQEVAAQTHQGLCRGVCVREKPRSGRHRILESPTLLPTPNPALRTLKAVSACRWASRVGPAGAAPVLRSLLPELCSAPGPASRSAGHLWPRVCSRRACSSHTPTALGLRSKAHSLNGGGGCSSSGPDLGCKKRSAPPRKHQKPYPLAGI